MSSSVRTRITLVATAVVALALLLASFVILRLVESDLVDATERALAAELELEAEIFGFDELQFFDFEVQDRVLSLGVFSEDEEGVAFGELLEGPVVIADIVIDLESNEVLEVSDPISGRPISDPSLVLELQEVALQVQDIDGDDGTQLLVGAAARDEVDNSLAAVRSALTVIVPALIVAMGLLIWLLVGRALRPVKAMSQQVQAISTSSLEQRVPVPAGSDAISHLAKVMNGMLERLQRGDERQRQFAADASHELRSPLSTVRAAAELIDANPGSTSAPGLAAEIVTQSDRMDQLIDDLLQLSRAEEGSGTDNFERLDLAAVVIDAAGDVVLHVSPDLFVQGSPDQLWRVVRNLVENARRHAAHEVRVSLARHGDSVELRVEDDGAGVPEQHRESIFERFSRLDEARSRDQGGAGLGLAVVRAIARRHGGRVRVEPSPELGGACFVVTLPVASSR